MRAGSSASAALTCKGKQRRQYRDRQNDGVNWKRKEAKMSLIDECRRRIVTTHVGSLPRRQSLSDLMLARVNKQPVDEAVLARETTDAVAEIVDKQLSLGIDIVSDGEQSKTSFSNYISDRLT